MEIKFRGKTLSGEWVYGYYIGPDKYHTATTIYSNGEHHVVDPKTVGQYIGFKDKEGKEIYSGDVYLNSCGKTTVIIMDEFHYHRESGPICGQGFVIDDYDVDVGCLASIITTGNIHDNPELRKKIV